MVCDLSQAGGYRDAQSLSRRTARGGSGRGQGRGAPILIYVPVLYSLILNGRVTADVTASTRRARARVSCTRLTCIRRALEPSRAAARAPPGVLRRGCLGRMRRRWRSVCTVFAVVVLDPTPRSLCVGARAALAAAPSAARRPQWRSRERRRCVHGALGWRRHTWRGGRRDLRRRARAAVRADGVSWVWWYGEAGARVPRRVVVCAPAG